MGNSSTRQHQPVTVVVWGDSIAASGWPQLMERTWNVCSNAGTAIRVVNSGRGGNPAARARHEFLTSVLIHRPEVVIIQFGLNDQRYDGSRGALPLSTPEEFGDHLGEMIRCCRVQACAEVLVFGNHRTLVPLLMPSGLSYDDTVQRYKRVAAQAAAVGGARFVDMELALRHPDVPYTRLLSDDGVHLSELGKQFYARVAASELQRLPLPVPGRRPTARSGPRPLAGVRRTALLPAIADIARVSYPAAGRRLRFTPVPHDAQGGFEDIRPAYNGTPQAGLLHARGRFVAARAGTGILLVGADGPYKVFINRRAVACKPQATNPIAAQVLTLEVAWRQGANEVLIALDTNAGKAWGFMALGMETR